MNKQKLISLILIGIIIFLLSSIFIGSRNRQNQNLDDGSPANTQSTTEAADIFYWGTTCPHCEDTIEWMEENNIDEILTVVRKEVYQNRQNSNELTAKATGCGINPNRVGVPFMYTSEGNCLIGTPDITGYLAEKIKQLETSPDSTASGNTGSGEEQ